MTWLSSNWPQVVSLALDHLLLALPAIVITVVVSVPIGRLAHQRPRIGRPLLGIATLLYAVPALPLLIVIPLVFGTPLRSNATMVIALSIYGVALLVRSAEDAFASVDPRVHDAAIAVGNSPRSVFWRVDLPLATPVLISGIRVVTVSTIALVTIGALIGISGLGTLLTDGFQRGIMAEVVTGVVVTIAVAFLLDGLLLIIGRVLTPWRHPSRAATAGNQEV
ncbi:MAG: ABC transporter permease subunit [Actinomyces sp.]|jgi:osmoprotectant transport system permease protein|nr:ABC transporter permease subunit [Actinomyces sp.]MCI1788036.1 ABC transporter permease subunit [Actinomyces sp.]MCI1830585.1 ABC transporter permease subunit [Actinomyces sp.]